MTRIINFCIFVIFVTNGKLTMTNIRTDKLNKTTILIPKVLAKKIRLFGLQNLNSNRDSLQAYTETLLNDGIKYNELVQQGVIKVN